MCGSVRGSATVKVGCGIAATLCLLCGCTPASRSVCWRDLGEVGWQSVGSHVWLSPVPLLPPGSDRERYAQAAERYLRSDPAVLDRLLPEPFDVGIKEPMPPRGRDVWAGFVADVRGVGFLLLRSESVEDRDERIERLLSDIKLKEQGKIFYLEDFMARDENSPDLDVRELTLQWEGDHGRVVYRLRGDVDRDAFVHLAVTYLRSNPTALKDRGDPATELLEDGIRAQDLWAGVVADLKGVPFELPASDSPAARNRRIEGMLKAIRKTRPQ